MKIRIQYRLFLALVAASGLAVIGMLIIMQWSLERGFLRYVNTLEKARFERLAEGLTQVYAEEGSWAFLENDPARLLTIMAATLPEEMVDPNRREHQARRLPPPDHPPPRFDPFFEGRVFLLDGERRPVFGPKVVPTDVDFTALVSKDETIGYLGLLPKRRISDAHQSRFVKQQKLAFALVGGLVLVVSGLFSLPLAKRLVRPIRTLAAATRRLAGGEYTTRVPVATSDELGQLACDFNALALTLEHNEQARRQWVADISHELRTPLAILRGEIEALQDGVRPATPETIRSLHAEALRLSRLVDDLYQLSLSDIGGLTYRKEMVDPVALLAQVLETIRPDFDLKRIAVSSVIPEGGPIQVFADPERLRQLFGNLLDNTLKYTEAGGKLELTTEFSRARVLIHLQDSAPGAPEHALGKLFDRLYRVEGSRSRSTGGAGLGLAICKTIVEAHEGTITAQPSPLGGLWVTITLPVAGKLI